MQKVSVCWFRRDLRLEDNAALDHALKSPWPVVPIFIFDHNILDKLEDKADRRVDFIHRALAHIQDALVQKGSTLEVFYGQPLQVFTQLLKKYSIQQVFANHDYEQYAIDRDEQVRALLKVNNATLHTSKDQVIFEKEEVVKEDGKPYTVFTPYSRKWKSVLNDVYLQSYPSEQLSHQFYRQEPVVLPSLASMGFSETGQAFPAQEWKDDLIRKYKEQRDFPAVQGTSRLGVHLRFGTISIRRLARAAKDLNESFLNELIWRDFYHMILWHFPHVRRGHAFRKEYEQIAWRNNEQEFEKWCKGNTGYPFVDAGMRELNATGFMHNRVRMIVASFLTKHLLIDWRWGEAYFAGKLLDFDFAANNGGWQWAAGSGCDAAPYFRVFNPTLQTEKFDQALKYIRKWVPELDSFQYPQPMVPHDMARKRALEVYGAALKK